jgi:hypothetical protein
MRRRLRERRREREARLLDLGALVYELHRQGRRAPELLQQKAAELTEIDDEVRELEEALDGRPEQPPASPPETGEIEVWEGPGPADEEPEASADEPEPAEDEPEPADEEPALAEHEEPRA